MFKRQKGLLAVLLACVMTIGSGFPASAAEPQDESQTPSVQAANDGLELSKSISLKDNGNYELTLEAYATGQRTTTTVTTKQPLDIILVLDQSGSMSESFGSGSDRTTKQAALKTAVDNFIDAIYADSTELNGKEGDVEHRLGIVTFGDDSSTLLNAQSVQSVEGNYQRFVNAVGNLPNSIYDEATNTGAGMTEANSMLPTQTQDRKTVVVLFTDGVPTTSTPFSNSVANTAINQAYQMKQKGATVYTIGIFDGANTSFLGNVGDTWSSIISGNYSENQKANRFMNLVSGNSATATDLGLGEGRLPTIQEITNNFDCDPSHGYYKTASNAGELNDVFEEISDESSSTGTQVQLDANSLLRDVVDTDNFRLPSDMDSDDVTITLIPGTRETNDSEIVWDLNAEADPAEIQDENFNITASVDSETSTVDVTGFSYQDYYVAPDHPGYKLVVKFEVQALHAGTDMTSNTTASAIYTDSTATTLVKPFEVPQVTIAQNTHVLDFGKKVEISKTGAQYVKAEPNAHGNATTYDTTDGYFAVEGSGISYQPQTTNWSSVDTGYVFGNNSGNYWEAESFLPATSVYYEDDFGYTTNGDGSQTKQDGYATIEYTGNWTTVSGGMGAKETQKSENKVYGTDDAYDGNLNYSDGSAHSAITGATAKFTFTGTGLDIYTRTTATSGQVIVQIKGQENGKIYTALVDNEFTSTGNGLYQIPTVSFQDVVRDTYDATITVLPDQDGNSTFYLDAIRVYNPMSEEDAVASEAYEQAGEANAVTKEVRDELIDAETFGTVSLEGIPETAGSVYIDKNSGSTTEIGTYEDLGPKNEVYLDTKTGVAFNIDSAQNYGKVLLGLKAPAGQASQVTVTNGELKKDIIVNSATDMYYEIIPDANGNVVIYNSGEAMIAVTKIRVTGVADTQNFTLMTTPALMSYVNSFDSLAYTEETIEPGTGEGDVDIETPSEPETPADPGTGSGTGDNTGNSTIKDIITEAVNSLWNSIWNGFSSWFDRW